MPRWLLRDRQVVADDWRHLDESAEPLDSLDCADARSSRTGLIVPFVRWQLEHQRWITQRCRLGVLLGPAQNPEDFAADLPRLSLIAVQFPAASEGRGYSQGRQLRERWNFAGELRAVGTVRQDQLFFLARCGFNAFELPEGELESACAAFTTFSAKYQFSNDTGLAGTLRHRD
ncbi:MAG TPA: DUF934 domain-containing protein [Steroidobacteraceae bacterium]|nr:DUF934 domain-containing protein [Steroidobacteraceae bacterium]